MGISKTGDEGAVGSDSEAGGGVDGTLCRFGRAAAGSPGRTAEVVTTWVVAGSTHSPWSVRLA